MKEEANVVLSVASIREDRAKTPPSEAAQDCNGLGLAA